MPENEFVPTRKTLFVLLLAAAPALLGGGAIASALPLISEAFPDASAAVVSLLITLPPLGTAAAGFFLGAVSDKCGRIKTLVVSTAVFAVCGGMGFFLNDIYAILVFRLISGIGMAGIMPVTATLLTEYFTGSKLAKYLGYYAAALGAGGTALSIICGFLAGFSWRAPFLVYFITLISIPLILIALKEPKRAKKPAHQADAGAKAAYSSSRGKMIGVILLVYLAVLLCQVFLYSMTTKTPYLLADMDGVSTAEIGIIVGIVGLFTAIAGIVYGKLATVFSHLQMLGVMFLFQATGLILIANALNPFIVAVGTSCIGFGIGLGTPVATRWLSEVTPSSIRGRIMGGMSACTYGGQFCATLVTAAVLALIPAYTGMYLTIGAVAFMLAAALLIGSLFRNKKGIK
ncbi:MAG TPA: MFS transporter [Methanocorpusculum sp.]|nr:MFS transporter [Methanocorpusculum sp.]